MRRTLPLAFDWHAMKFGAILMGVAIFLHLDVYKEWRLLAEAGLYIGFLGILAAQRPVQELLSALPVLQRRGLVGFIGLLLVAHVWGDSHKTYPFVRWNMYTGSMSGVPEYFEYTGICADGREVTVPVHRVFRSQRRNTTAKLRRLWTVMHSADDRARSDRAAREYVALLAAVVNRFNEVQPGSHVRSVRVTQCTMSRPSPGVRLEVARRPLREFVVE